MVKGVSALGKTGSWKNKAFKEKTAKSFSSVLEAQRLDLLILAEVETVTHPASQAPETQRNTSLLM